MLKTDIKETHSEYIQFISRQTSYEKNLISCVGLKETKDWSLNPRLDNILAKPFRENEIKLPWKVY